MINRTFQSSASRTWTIAAAIALAWSGAAAPAGAQITWKPIGLPAGASLTEPVAAAYSTDSFTLVGTTNYTGSFYSTGYADAFGGTGVFFTATLQDVLFAGDRFVAVGDSGVIQQYGTRSAPASGLLAPIATNLTGIAQLGSNLVAVGAGGTVLLSVDGSNWSSAATAPNADLSAVAAGDTRLVAVGAGGATFASTNAGLDWFSGGAAGSNDLHGVSYARGTFCAVGAGGSLWISTNGAGSWAARGAGTSNDLAAVASAGNIAVAVGDGGVIIASRDRGQTWALSASGTSNDLSDVSFGPAPYRFLAVGAEKTVLEGTPPPALTGDVDGDDAPDLMVQRKNAISVVFLNGLANSGLSNAGPGELRFKREKGFSAADLNLDGRAELLTLAKKTLVTYRFDNGAFASGSPVSLPTGQKPVGAGQIDGQGPPEIVVRKGKRITALQGGNFTAETVLIEALKGASVIGVAQSGTNAALIARKKSEIVAIDGPDFAGNAAAPRSLGTIPSGAGKPVAVAAFLAGTNPVVLFQKGSALTTLDGASVSASIPEKHKVVGPR